MCTRVCVIVCEHLVGEGMRVHLSVLWAQPRKGLRTRKPIVRMVTPVWALKGKEKHKNENSKVRAGVASGGGGTWQVPKAAPGLSSSCKQASLSSH